MQCESTFIKDLHFITRPFTFPYPHTTCIVLYSNPTLIYTVTNPDLYMGGGGEGGAVIHTYIHVHTYIYIIVTLIVIPTPNLIPNPFPNLFLSDPFSLIPLFSISYQGLQLHLIIKVLYFCITDGITKTYQFILSSHTKNTLKNVHS